MNNDNAHVTMGRLEKTIAEAREAFDGILDFSLTSDGLAPHRFEKQLFELLLALGKILLQIFFISFGSGDRGREIVNDEGVILKRYRRRSIDYVSVFGSVEIERYYYWSSGARGVCPQDEELNLPERVYSYHLQEVVVRHAVDQTYERAVKNIGDTFGIVLSPRSIMDILQDCSTHADAFREEQPAPASEGEGEILVVSVDGKGVPMRKEHLADRKIRLGRGEKNQKKKVSSVAAVYTIEKNVRSVPDVVGKREGGEKKPSPRPHGKKIQAKLGDKSEKEKFIGNIRSEADKRDPHADKSKVFLCDGDRFFWGMKDKYFSDYVGVLDLYHVMEKLWTVSHCFHREGSSQAEELVTLCLEMLLGGNAVGCVEFMKASSHKSGMSASCRETISGVIKYFKRNLEHMRYDTYLSMGLPIGSGNVEAACKNLIRDRMEGCGMRWCKNGADAMLALRAIFLNGDLASYFEHHVENERKRLYGEAPNWTPVEPIDRTQKMAA